MVTFHCKMKILDLATYVQQVTNILYKQMAQTPMVPASTASLPLPKLQM